MKDKLIIITGPTASGKSDIAINIAQRFNGEVISCDSQQIYRDMNIGTNKELDYKGINHHMIDIIDPDYNFSVEDFSRFVNPLIHDINNKGRVPILTGGTGFYIDSVLFEMNYGKAKKNPEIRKKLQKISQEKGNSYLYNKLKEIDPLTASKYHENETNRIIRSLEIYEISGQIPSEVRKGEKVLNENIDPILFFLNYKDRSELYEKINNRVIEMIDSGLVEEFTYINNKYKLSMDSQSMSAIGYKEIYPFLNNDIDKSQMIDLIQKNTRHYAKRQVTWMKRYLRYNFAHEIIMDNLSKKDATDNITRIIKEFYEF